MPWPARSLQGASTLRRCPPPPASPRPTTCAHAPTSCAGCTSTRRSSCSSTSGTRPAPARSPRSPAAGRSRRRPGRSRPRTASPTARRSAARGCWRPSAASRAPTASEGGYGETPADVGETIARAIAAGAVGCNLEDGVRNGELLRDAEDAAARVAAARERADAEGVPIVINARTDVYLRGADDPEAAILRGQAYARAGADCIFVPGVTDRETIKALVDGIDAPVSVLARPGAPSVSELQELGIARVSFGPGPMGVALAALARTASDLLGGGVPADELSYRPPAV